MLLDCVSDYIFRMVDNLLVTSLFNPTQVIGMTLVENFHEPFTPVNVAMGFFYAVLV